MEQLTEDLDRKNSIDVIYFDYTLPYGIPLMTSVHDELWPFNTTLCFLSCKKSSIQSSRLDALENMIKLFADDTKVFATVNNEEDKNSLQGDIDKLMNWSDTMYMVDFHLYHNP
jgi:hypothetical protein